MSPAPLKPPARKRRGNAPIFAALGDETRLSLVRRLSAGSPVSIARLTEGSTLTRQAITKHLRVLQDAGLVRGVRRGRENLFALDPEPLGEARRAIDRIAQHWENALDRLKQFVEP
jgi:DNA-binding transcriptional ArsR family regulator